jgi:hypothetical protein
VWALVAWGGLLLLLLLGHAVEGGLHAALAELRPGASAWGWLNTLSAGLALAVGLVAAGVWVWGRLSGSKSGHSEE